MGINVGGIDLVETIINLELRVNVLERLLDNVVRQLPGGSVDAKLVARYQSEALLEMQKKYPALGLKPKS